MSTISDLLISMDWKVGDSVTVDKWVIENDE